MGNCRTGEINFSFSFTSTFEDHLYSFPVVEFLESWLRIPRANFLWKRKSWSEWEEERRGEEGDTKAGLCRVGMYLALAHNVSPFSYSYLKLGNPTYTHVSPLGNLLVRWKYQIFQRGPPGKFSPPQGWIEKNWEVIGLQNIH